MCSSLSLLLRCRSTQPCPPGQYSPAPGAASCTPCPERRLAFPEVGSTECVACPDGSTCVGTSRPFALEGFFHAPGYPFKFHACGDGRCGASARADNGSPALARSAMPSPSAVRRAAVRRNAAHTLRSSLPAAGTEALEDPAAYGLPEDVTPPLPAAAQERSGKDAVGVDLSAQGQNNTNVSAAVDARGAASCASVAGLYVDPSRAAALNATCTTRGDVCLVRPAVTVTPGNGLATCEYLEYIGVLGGVCAKGHFGPLVRRLHVS